MQPTLTAPGAPFPYANGPLNAGGEVLLFDPSTGQLDPASPQAIEIEVPNGANPLVIDVSQSSELADEFQILASDVNGNTPSSVQNVEFGKDGTLYAVYGNGARIGIYRIPLATVASPDNLKPEAGNAYSLSATSGALQLGFPGSAGFGSIRSSALEKSTVDTATELTTMIGSQFAFTANSKVFQTGGELMEVLVNLKR